MLVELYQCVKLTFSHHLNIYDPVESIVNIDYRLLRFKKIADQIHTLFFKQSLISGMDRNIFLKHFNAKLTLSSLTYYVLCERLC